MKINIYNKFNTIPYANSIKDYIPVFALQCYADWIQFTKGYTTLWFEGLIEEHDRFIIPFSVMKKGPFKKGMFLTEVLLLGSSYSFELEKDFLNSIISEIRSEKLCDWIQQPPNCAIFNTYPDGAIYAPFGSHIIDLKNNSVEQLLSNLKRKDRQEIHKAARNGVDIKQGKEHLNAIYELIQNTARKGQIAYPSYPIFKIMFEKLDNNILGYIAYFKGSPQSAVVFLFSKFCTYGLYAGTVQRPVAGSTAYLFWQAIKDAKLRNNQQFDFVGARINPPHGSKDERIQKFKESFGVKLKKGYLWKYPISNVKYKFYLQFTKTKSILVNKRYKADLIDQELDRRKDD